MRIAHVSDCYLPRLGGIEAQVHGLAVRQRAAGHEVVVLTATPGARGERHGATEMVDGVPVRRLAIRLPFELPVNPFAPRDVRSILLSGRIEAVHVHAGVVSPFAYDAIRAVLDLGLPMVVTWHCVLGRTEAIGKIWERLRDWSDRPLAFTAVSDHAAEPLRRILGDSVPVSVLPNGVDVAAWRAFGPPRAAGPAARAEAEVRLVSATRFARRKRPIPLLQMATHLRELVPPPTSLRLTILGEGPARRSMEAFVRRHDLGAWVDLPGRVGSAELARHYAASDIYVAPARMESFGIAALEARAAGLPVVARSDSGVREYIRHGVDGLLVGSDDEMVTALARLVGDPVERQRISAHNWSTAPDQDWPAVVALADQEYARAARLVGAAA